MPETKLGHERFFLKIASNYAAEANPDGSLYPSVIKQYARYSGENVLGSGAYHIVVGSWDDTRKVSAWAYNEGLSEQQAKEQFYAHRILNILFPHNFPRFHAVFWRHGKSINELSGSIRQLVKEDFFRYKYKYPFREADSKRRNIPLLVEFDSRSANYAVGNDGGQYYVDVVKTEGRIDEFLQKRTAIYSYMYEAEYPEQDIYRVRKSLDRLQVLRDIPQQ